MIEWRGEVVVVEEEVDLDMGKDLPCGGGGG